MNNNRRRSFRPRNHKNGFRRRNGHSVQSQNSSFQISGNRGFKRNGVSMNPQNLEKTIQKFQQLAKDAQSNGDPILAQNYYQHADHYLRKLNELTERKDSNGDKSKISDKFISQEETLNKDITQTSN